MPKEIPKKTFFPPPGRPSWAGTNDLPLLYLGWGNRDFGRDPLAFHFDLGTNYHVLLRGELVLQAGKTTRTIHAPTALLIDPECAFSITQSNRSHVEILVWIWQGRPSTPELCPSPGSFTTVPLKKDRISSLVDLHVRCRDEVALADGCLNRTLLALRDLVEIEILRSFQTTPLAAYTRWKLTQSWMTANLAINSPVPALCDYLRMSPSTLHRFFLSQTGQSPGAFFRNLKMQEARRLINDHKRQVKDVAYHLGYRHSNDLSRALSSASGAKRSMNKRRQIKSGECN